MAQHPALELSSSRLLGEKLTGGKRKPLIERVLIGQEVMAHMKISKKPVPGGTDDFRAGDLTSVTEL